MVFKHPEFSNKKTFKTAFINGIVTAQDKSSIGLDRLCDGENIWNKNSVLTCRPGLVPTEGGIISDYSSNTDINKVFYADFPFEKVYGYNRLCAIVKELPYERTEIDIFVADSHGAVHYLAFYELVGPNGKTAFEIKNILFVKDKPLRGCGIFLLIPIKQHDGPSDTELKEVRYYELNSDCNGLVPVDPSSFYRPLIIKHGFGNAVPLEISKTRTTSYPEGVNILGGNFEACYTTDGTSHAFLLPTSVAENAPAEVRLYTSSTDYVTFTVPPRSSSSNTVSFMQNNINVYLNRSTGEFMFYSGGAPYNPPAVVPNNGLRVFSNADTADAAYELLSCNARPISFDNRIFIPGGENRGNKIYYSGKNNHLYFCERNHVPVGNTNYNLTAISLQSRYVIAFKEKELYRLSLTESMEIDRTELFNNDSILEMPVPTCTTTRINDSIGCDLPSTIVNCSNRLVWFHSDGAVYTLYGSNLYTDGSVYELSGEISDRLKNLSELKLNSAFAAEVGGYYVLGIDDKMYIMDVRVSGFRYLSGHKAPSKDYGGLPWFIWKAPKDIGFVSAFLCGGNEYFVLRSYRNRIIYIAELNGEKDIIPARDGDTESLPEFSLSTPIFGDSQMYTQRITVNATAKNSMSLQVFDDNGVFKTAPVTGGERLRSFIIPLHYKKGGIGITIKGRGQFCLKDIIYDLRERKY